MLAKEEFMYTNYEEMKEMRRQIQKIADGFEMRYGKIIERMKRLSEELPKDINNEGVRNIIFALDDEVWWIKDVYKTYLTATAVVKEIDEAIEFYEEDFSQEEIEYGIADEAKAVGDFVFQQIKSQNPQYKVIIDIIAQCEKYNKLFDGLYKSLDDTLALLKSEFEAGRISKSQLILYSNVCVALFNNPEYIKDRREREIERQVFSKLDQYQKLGELPKAGEQDLDVYTPVTHCNDGEDEDPSSKSPYEKGNGTVPHKKKIKK